MISSFAAVSDYNDNEEETECEEGEEEEEEELEEMTVAAEISATLTEVAVLEAEMSKAKEIPIHVTRLPCCAHKV